MIENFLVRKRTLFKPEPVAPVPAAVPAGLPTLPRVSPVKSVVSNHARAAAALHLRLVHSGALAGAGRPVDARGSAEVDGLPARRLDWES